MSGEASQRRRQTDSNREETIEVKMMQRVLFLLCFAAFFVTGSRAASPAPQDLVANTAGRATISLSGTWNAIVDPYENGLGGRFYQNRKAQNKQDLVEYDFDKAGTLKVPGDWNSQRDSLYFYEGPLWYETSFAYKKRDGVRPFEMCIRDSDYSVRFGTDNRSSRMLNNWNERSQLDVVVSATALIPALETP